jgi:hypothetical protein
MSQPWTGRRAVAVKLRERNGSWWLYINWHGQRKAKRFQRREAAEAVRIALEARLVLGAKTIFEPEQKPARPAAPLLFVDYFRTWLDTYAKLACKASTWRSYERDFRRYLEPAFGTTPLGRNLA